MRCNALRKRPTSSLPRLYARVICSRYQPSPSPSRAFSLHPPTPPRYRSKTHKSLTLNRKKKNSFLTHGGNGGRHMGEMGSLELHEKKKN